MSTKPQIMTLFCLERLESERSIND